MSSREDYTIGISSDVGYGDQSFNQLAYRCDRNVHDGCGGYGRFGLTTTSRDVRHFYTCVPATYDEAEDVDEVVDEVVDEDVDEVEVL